MKILCDYHHAEVNESILKVFEDRLGWEVYRPVGRSWATEGYWKIGTNSDTIDQFLHEGAFIEGDNDKIIEEVDGFKYYYATKKHMYNRKFYRTVSLEKAKTVSWDIIITTLFNHFTPMESFRKKYCPSAKHILQFGNVPPEIPEGAINIMN